MSTTSFPSTHKSFTKRTSGSIMVRKCRHLTAFVIATVGLIGMGGISTASAQSDNYQTTLEEIVVTAQRRQESSQEVPIAITALTTEFLIEKDIRTLEDLNGLVPGFVTTNSVAYSQAPLSIRGIGGSNGGANIFADEPVAVYVDGIYIGRLSFSTADLVDISSVEVIRGPQGTLFGRNSTAGALLINTATPTEELEGNISAGWTSLDEWRASGVLSGALVKDRILARAAVSYSDRSGFGDNLVNGSDLGGSEDFTARLRLRFLVSDTLTIDLINEYQERRAKPLTFQIADISNPLASSPFILRDDLDQMLDSNNFAINDPQFANSETLGSTLAINWDLGNVVVDLLSGYRSWELNGAQDSDGSGFSNFNNNGRLDNKQFSQEIRIRSNNERRTEWVAGAYYLHEDNEMSPLSINNFNGFFGLGTNAIFNAFQDLDAVAVFADVAFQVTDQLTIRVGGRYSDENKKFENNQDVFVLNGGTVPPFIPGIGGLTLPPGTVLVPPATFNDEESWDDFSGRAVLDYKISKDVLLYTSYTQGFKSGGFNSFGLDPAFMPESIEAVEFGAKADFMENRLRTNVAVFYYDYTNLQVRRPVPTGGAFVENAPAAEVMGFELEVTALPAQGLRITGNIAYLDTEFKGGQLSAVPNDLLFPIGAPIPLETVDIDGNRLSRAPEWQLYLAGDYSFRMGNWGTSNLLVSLQHQSSVFFTETDQDQPTFRSNGWEEVDVRLTFTTADQRYELALFGSNIFDSRHITQVSALGSFPLGAVNEPAKFGILGTLRY